MTSALIIGDVHLSEKPPSSRTPDYAEEILAKLNFCVGYANEHSLPIVQAGDLFHLKAPSRNSHRLVQAVHSVLRDTNHGVFIVPGNHDLSGDRLDSLDSQPLGALLRMKNMNALLGTHADLPDVAGIPYLTEFDGGDWRAALDPWQGRVADCDLLVTHAPIFPPGQEPGVYASIPAREWAEYWYEVETNLFATYYGHIHDCHGAYEFDDICHAFCNQGALSRGSLHESSVTRQPAVTHWDGSFFTRVEVPHKPSEEVFLFAEAEQAADNRASALEFAAQLGATKVVALTLEAVASHLRATVQDTTILSIIERVLSDG
jgi:hypothetical protein